MLQLSITTRVSGQRMATTAGGGKITGLESVTTEIEEKKLMLKSKKQRLEDGKRTVKQVNSSVLGNKLSATPCSGCGGEKVNLTTPQNIENVLREHLTGE